MHKWSSYRCHAESAADDVTPHAIVRRLHRDEEARRRAYRELFQTDIDDATLKRIRDSVQHGWALGGDAFIESLEARTGRRPSRLPLGRRRTSK
jgi:putative transposase